MTVKRNRNKLLAAGAPILILFYLFTPIRPVQFLCLFLVFLLLGAKAYSEFLIRHLRMVRCDNELRAFRYQWLKVELRVENSGILPAFLHIAEDESGGVAVFRNIKNLYTLSGKSSRMFSWEAYCSFRGVHTLGPATLRGSDPLGLFPFSIVCDETAKLYIYPAAAHADFSAPGGIPLGNLVTLNPFNEDMTRPRSIREYKSGDDSRRINWKASAKNSGDKFLSLLVNEYDLSLSYPLVLFLNIHPAEYPVKNRTNHIERVIEAAAALCLMAAREKQSLGLILHTTREAAENIPDTINPAAFTMIPVLEKLAEIEPFKNYDPDEERNAPNENELKPSTEKILEKGKTLTFGTRLFYIGPHPGNDGFNALETLRKRRLTMEFLIIDEKTISIGKTGALRKYQMKETGYDIV